MKYKGYYIDNIDGVDGETIHAWMNALDEYERLLTEQAEHGGVFEEVCNAGKLVDECRDAIEKEYASKHAPLPSIKDFKFSDLVK